MGRARSSTAALRAIERRFGGRIGVLGLDTGTGLTVAHRADQRFLMCSVAKVGVVAAVLERVQRRLLSPEQIITYSAADLLPYSPVTTRHLATGLSIGQLCAAAVSRSDNTASRLLMALVGGPGGVTAFFRSFGSEVTRFDRFEPELHEAVVQGLDTTTPAAFARDLQALVLGGALTPASSRLLTRWLIESTTGAEQIRAGVPQGWTIGDKTGAGCGGESNDVAVIRPPGREPLVLTIFTVADNPQAVDPAAVIAEVAAAVVCALG